MDSAKKAGFARKFGKKRLRLRNGGVVPHFDGGGLVNTPQGIIPNISNALGLAPQSANITPGTNAEQLGGAYTGATNAINAQTGLTNTLIPQAAEAVGTQSDLVAQEMAMARGEGPNPAANQLAQATRANVDTQAALAAGQRGAAGNVGLIARQAAQQGATTQQQAAGQAATMGAEQEIAAQNNAANIANTQIGQSGQAATALNTAQQNEQNILQNANTSSNNAAVGMQGNINNNNANTNGNILGGVTKMAGNIPVVGKVLGGIFGAEGGQVTPEGFSNPNHHGHKKLDFVHKMAKLGLQHFDEGGSVSPSPSPVPISTQGAQEVSDSFKGHSGLDNLKAALGFADGGEVDAHGAVNTNGGQYTSSSPSSGPSIAAPPAQSKDDGGMGQIASLAMLALADGGQIHKNPLIPGVNKVAVQNKWGGNYSQSSSSGGPSMSDPAFQPVDMGSGKNDKSDPMAGAEDITPVASAVGGASEMGNPNMMNAYHGGEIHSHFDNHFKNYFAKGGSTNQIPAMVSPGEVYLSPEQVQKVINEGANPLKIGQKFSGKARVKGDSLKNDTIPVTLESGGVVIDRKNVMSPEKAELFVHKSIARHKAGGKK